MSEKINFKSDNDRFLIEFDLCLQASGTGKTSLGRILATELPATSFISVSCQELVGACAGDGREVVRHTFEQARAKKPAVVFLDQLDALCSPPAECDGAATSLQQVRDELMVQLQEGKKHDPEGPKVGCVKVVATTNVPWTLDVDLLKLFEKMIYLPLPDERVRLELLQRETKRSNLEVKPEELQSLAQETEGYSGGELYGTIKALTTQDLPSGPSEIRQALRMVQVEDRMKLVAQFERFNKEHGVYC